MATSPQIPDSPIADISAELQYIKSHSIYRFGRKLRQSGAWNLLRWLRNRNRDVVTVESLDASGEICLIYAGGGGGASSVPWDFIEHDRAWQRYPAAGRAYGQCLIARGPGLARVPVDENPELRFVTGPSGGRVRVRFRGRDEVIELKSAAESEVRVCPAQTPMSQGFSRAVSVAPTIDTSQTAVGAAAFRAHSTDEEFLRRVRETRPQAVAIHCPRWLGVTHSTRTLFDCCYAVPRTPDIEPYHWDSAALAGYADTLLASEVKHFVFSGGDELHFALMQLLRKREPGVRCDLLWHGGYLFFDKDYDWRILRMWMDAARAGELRLLGTVKAGMEQFFNGVGIPSRLVLNYVPGDPSPTPRIDEPGKHVGIWMSDQTWKVPHAMLAAMASLPDVRLHAAGLSRRAREVAEYFELPLAYFHDGKLPQPELHAQIRRTHLTLYVTFTECCPMLPLESIRNGVPCLVGPTSHLFEDHAYLLDRLIVPFPERADVIARVIARALDERDQITTELQQYIPEYNERARRSVEQFLAD